MAALFLSRRLNPTTTTTKLLSTLLIPKNPSPIISSLPKSTPKPPFFPNSTPSTRSISQSISWIRHYSSTTPPPPKPESHTPPPPNPSSPLDDFKHQEIEGPTVERDESALANETREVLDKMHKSIHGLSSAMALLGVAHLGLGAWLAFSHRASPLPDEVAVQAIMAFAFPFSSALLMRNAIKPMAFFRKMEELGRLQILTTAMQACKGVIVLFVRTRVVAISCIVGVSAGSLVTILMR